MLSKALNLPEPLGIRNALAKVITIQQMAKALRRTTSTNLGRVRWRTADATQFSHNINNTMQRICKLEIFRRNKRYV